MYGQRSRSPATWVLGLVVLAQVFGGSRFASAQDQEAPLPLADLLSRAQALAKANQHAEALRVLVAALETYPEDNWDRQDFAQVIEWCEVWFDRVGKAERERLLTEYDADVPEGGRSSVPILRTLVQWFDSIMPPTKLESPGGRLALAIWYSLEGHHYQFVAYAAGGLQLAPDSLSTEHALRHLVFMQRYRFDKRGLARTIQIAVKLAPDNPGTGWALGQYLIKLWSRRSVSRTRQLCQEILAEAPDTLASDFAAEVLALMGEVKSMDYDRAIRRMWDVRELVFYGPVRPVLEVLCEGITLYRLESDAASQERYEALSRAAEGIASGDRDAGLRSFALCLLAHCQEGQGHRRQAAELYLKAAPGGHPEVVEHVLCNAGRQLAPIDPDAAIRAIEQFLAMDDAEGWGWEPVLKLLARLYRQQGRYEEGLAWYLELRRRCEFGSCLFSLRPEALTAGAAACLEGLGLTGEADVLLDSVLVDYDDGTPLSELPKDRVLSIYAVFKEMGRTKEAQPFWKEYLRRLGIERP